MYTVRMGFFQIFNFFCIHVPCTADCLHNDSLKQNLISFATEQQQHHFPKV